MIVTTIPLCELVEDMEVYPRHEVDPAHVASLVRALESGATLPPIVAEKKSKIIVDGWHRARAYRKVLGPQGIVDVELHTYRDQASLLLDAVTRNATHGRKLDAIDQTRVVVMLTRAQVDIAKIAVALHVPEMHVRKLSVRVATTSVETAENITGTRRIALKRPVAHLAGTKLTEEQAKVHGLLPGTSFLLIARQLCEALQQNMVNLEDARLMEQMRLLKVALDRVLA